MGETLTGKIRERLLALTSVESPVRLTRREWIVLGSLTVLLFLPLLTYPLGPDNGLFFVAGQKIVRQGAVPYRDIVDVKPPLIYYLNAVAIFLFGNHPVSIRILDLLLQLVTCFFLFKLIRRATQSDTWTAVALLLYAVMYISTNFANTSQVESFTGLLSLPAIYLFLFRRNWLGFLAIGLLCGILTFFKFTFGIALAAFLLSDLLLYRDSWKERVRNYAALGGGYAVILGIFFLYLILFDALHGFQNMQTFLKGYTGLQWASKAGLLRDVLQEVPKNMADEYSLTMLLGTVVGIGGAMAGISRRSAGIREGERSEVDNEGTRLLRICTIFFLFLLGTIALEAKWLHYHLIRLFPFGAILGGYGLMRIARIFAAKEVGRFRWVAFPLALILLLAFSPITRYAFHLRPAVLMLTRGPEAFDSFYSYGRVDDDWTMEELQKIGTYVKAHRKEGEKLFVSSGVGGMLYLQCDYIPDFYIFHSGFIIAPFSPQEWRDSTRNFLLSERPRFVVVQQGDRMLSITGTKETSAGTIRTAMPEVERMLHEEYTAVITTKAFVVYEKREVVSG